VSEEQMACIGGVRRNLGDILTEVADGTSELISSVRRTPQGRWSSV
jgi:hypothetical protein